MKVNKFYPFAFIYFFVNAVGLPFGLLYTIILTPVFYIWIVLKGQRLVVVEFILLFAPFIFWHLYNGVDLYFYFKSLLLYLSVYIFCYAFYILITRYDVLAKIFWKLLVANFILTIIALISLFTPYRSFFWLDWSITVGGISIENWPRLVMMTYESSYYSTLWVPIFAYYFIKFILKQLRYQVGLTLLMVILPLVLSLSMGVIATLIVATSFLILLNLRKFLSSRKVFYSFSIAGIAVLIVLILLVVFYPQNPFFVRILAIVTGQDGSANGRTYEAFQLAYDVAVQKSIWWGVGPGQLKILGDSIIKEFYHYPEDYGRVSIPNTFAETFAVFGIVGSVVRLLVELYLFFKTKVLDNYYRTLLFFFAFVYQFTGSFTTNIAEYVIWILAFTNIFPEFDRRSQGNESVKSTVT